MCYVKFVNVVPLISRSNESLQDKKKDVGMRLFVQCFYALSLHLVSVVFGTAIPTSLYIFGLFTCISLAGTLLVFSG